jgi:hypothetical protein
MNLLIFYKLLKKLRLMSIKINRLEEGHNSYPFGIWRPVETMSLQRRRFMRLEPLISHTSILMTFYLSIILDLQNFFHWYILQSWKLTRPQIQLRPHHFWTLLKQCPSKGDKYVIDEELQHTDHLFFGVACFTFLNFVWKICGIVA